MISGEQVVKLKQEQHLQTFLQCLDSCRQFTRGFPGLGRGAACLCGAAGLDVVSAQGCIRLQNFQHRVSCIILYIYAIQSFGLFMT